MRSHVRAACERRCKCKGHERNGEHAMISHKKCHGQMFCQYEDILRGRCLISYQFCNFNKIILMKFLMIIYHSLTLKNTINN